MQRVSTYRLTLLLILCAGIAVESRITTSRAHLLLTDVLSRFPTRINAFQGADLQTPLSKAVRRTYWPAEVVDRLYTNGNGETIRVFVSPDFVGAHRPDVCAQYSGWKVLQEANGVLPGVPLVKLTRIVEAPPQAPGETSSTVACAQYWRQDERGLSDDAYRNLFIRGGFSFRVLMCTEIQSSGGANDAFARLDTFAASTDPVVCQFLRRAEAE
jgi:hypothetical protein